VLLRSRARNSRVGPALIGLGVVVLLGGSPATAQPSPAKLAKEIAELRVEVERIESDLGIQRAQQEAELRSLVDQQAELDVLIQREELRVQTVRAEIERLRKESQQLDASTRDLVPVLLDQVARLRTNADEGLPFRIDDRRAELDEIADGVRLGTLDPRTTSARLWQHVEDELKLRDECGLSRQAIELDGERMLVRVAHVGMVALYARTDDGRYAMAQRDGGGWRFEELDGDEARAAADLFDSFDKQVRSGQFTLPLPPLGGHDVR